MTLPDLPLLNTTFVSATEMVSSNVFGNPGSRSDGR